MIWKLACQACTFQQGPCPEGHVDSISNFMMNMAVGNGLLPENGGYYPMSHELLMKLMNL